MRYILTALVLTLSACSLAPHPKSGNGCMSMILATRTLPEVQSALERLGVEKGLAAKTAEALMTSRLTPDQVCGSL